MLQNMLVGLLVLAALLYVVGRYMPKKLRKRLGGGAQAVEGGCDSGCGSCQGCPSQTDRQ